MAKGYLDLMKQARALAEKDLHGIVGKLQELGQHFPDLVDQAVGAIARTGKRIKMAATTTAPAASETKAKAKRTKLTKAEAEELRGMVKSALKGKVKQVDFLKQFLAEHRKFKEATVQKIITDFRKEKVFKDEPVVKGNSKAGIYLLPGK